MIKIGQSKNLYVKSYTKDNFPYLEVFTDSTKKTSKGKLELQRVTPHKTDPTKKLLHFTQNVRVIYQKPAVTHGHVEPSEDNFQDSSYQRVSDTIFTKTYTCVEEVPVSVTLEMIEDKILQNKRSCLYTILSNYPINTLGPRDIQEFTQEDITKQILTYHEDEEPFSTGDLFLDKNDKPQYRVTRLSLTGQQDIDLRTSLEGDYFLPEYLKSKSYGRRK